MSQSLLEMAKELVMAQIQSQQVAPEAMNGVLNSTYETLRNLQTAESSGVNGNGNGNGNGLNIAKVSYGATCHKLDRKRLF